MLQHATPYIYISQHVLRSTSSNVLQPRTCISSVWFGYILVGPWGLNGRLPAQLPFGIQRVDIYLYTYQRGLDLDVIDRVVYILYCTLGSRPSLHLYISTCSGLDVTERVAAHICADIQQSVGMGSFLAEHPITLNRACCPLFLRVVRISLPDGQFPEYIVSCARCSKPRSHLRC